MASTAMTTGNKNKRLTLRDMDQNDDDLFVMNTYSRLKPDGKNRETAVINLAHVTHGNYAINIIIQPTWIPINLSDFAPREEIVKNHHFLELVRKGVLTLVKTKEALEILEEDAAQEELERINNLRAGMEENTPDVVVGDIKGNVKPPELGQDPGATPGQLDMSQVNDGILAAVRDVMAREGSEISDTQRYSVVRSLLQQPDGLDEKNLRYILNESPKDSNLAKLASDKLKEMRDAN